MAIRLHARARFILTAVVLLAACGGIVSAQRNVRERVRFEPGRTSAVLRGSVSGRTSREYVLDARKGQYMTVHLSGERGPVFDISSPDGSGLSELEIRDWEGALPRSGAYRIRVYGETENLPQRRYTLEIGIR